eukprot:gnl/MRDRNA2_/MRDRNA2_313323_c0_seq1.p1 gnl/MRDRNA2_/MRDRNA2_313323_c0~~gnl/MRDRNA2_/MRDRNA2_313323_c0_seq1.p1  ORF type:complete len:198 (-),score=35.04 gnl/MRDRNA2_/MRDRNA2_313323_c0_seq1:43-615(-)
MGAQRAKPENIMIITQLNIAVGLLFIAVRLAWFLKCLPQILLHKLINEMKDQRLLWKDGIGLDSNELSAIFRFIDCDHSGSVTMHEILKTFENHGLNWKEEEVARFRSKFFHVCDAASRSMDSQMDLDHFRSYFKELFGGKLVRHMNRAKVGAMQKEEDPGPQPAVPDTQPDTILQEREEEQQLTGGVQI